MAKKIPKIPPQNIEAEEAFLGSLLIDSEAIIKVADLISPKDFYSDIHRIIYEVILELWEKRQPIDILSVANRLAEKNELDSIGGRSFLVSLTNKVPTSTHVVSYAEIIQKKSSLRKLINAASEITGLAYEESEETEKILDKSEQKLFSISQRFIKRNFIPLRDILGEAYERISAFSSGEKGLVGVPTGFIDLDNLLGCLQPANLILLAARPSIGKSALALDIVRNAAVYYKIPIGIFSLEMSADQVIERLIAAQSNVNLWQLKTGRIKTKDDDGDFKKINQAMALLGEAPIFIDDSPLLSVNEMRTKARRLQLEHQIGLLVIDYLQLMDSSSFSDNRVEQVSEISRALKALSRELNVPILALSQLSRAPEARAPSIPKLSDLRESGCLVGDTLIKRADTGELIPIKKLAQRKEQTPISVMAVDKDYKLKSYPMIRAFSSGKKMVFELKTRSGRKIKASANHPFLRLDGWKRLDELNIGDEVAGVAQKIKVFPLFTTSRVAWYNSGSDIFWDKIVSIKKLDVEEVYDATVAGAHNFVANDIIVHNSLEQDSDVVMFLYRKAFDKSIKNCSEEERPITEIHLAKHRHGPAGRIVRLYFDEGTASFKNLEKEKFEELETSPF